MESQTAGSSSVLETLNSLKEVISLFDYRRFLNAVHRTAWHLVKSNGQSTRHSNIDTTCEIFIEVLSQTDLAKQLVVMLGYEEISQSEGTLFMLDFNKHLSSLKSFCNVTEPQILVTVGDPAADKPPPDANNTFHIIAYISYHLYIRILLVLRCTEQPLLYTQEDKLVRSFQAVESAALKLGIMQPEFGVREVWDSCKRAALDFVTTPDANSGETLDKSLSDTIQMINEEVETKFSFHVHGVMSYLQNLQALARMTYDAAPIPSHAFPIFRRNEGRFSRSILSDEYRTSMDEVRSLMDTACQRGLTADEREQLYGRFKWQTENFLSSLRQLGPPAGGYRTTEARPTDENARIEMMKDTLELIRQAVNPAKYRAFVQILALHVNRSVESEGETTMHLNSSQTAFDLVTTATPLVSRLMWLLGYEDCEEHDVLVLRNVSEHKATLKAFLSVTSEDTENVGISGDPARNVSAKEIGSRGALVAHLAYHYRLRCFLLTVQSNQRCIASVEQEIEASMAAVDAIAIELGIMRTSDVARSVWETIKGDIRTLCRTGYTTSDTIASAFENMDALMVRELGNARCPYSAVHLLAVCQNMAAAVVITSRGEMLIREHAQTYLMTSTKLAPNAFSSKFMTRLKETQELVRTSFSRQLTGEEILHVNKLLVWQVSNFLTNLNPAGFEGGLAHASLATMATDIGLDYSALVEAYHAGVSVEEMALTASVHQHTDFAPQQSRNRHTRSGPQRSRNRHTRIGPHRSAVPDKARHRTTASASEAAAKTPETRQRDGSTKEEDAVSKSSTTQREENTESKVRHLLSIVTSSDGPLEHVDRASRNLNSSDTQTALSELESLIRETESTRQRLETEIRQIEYVCAREKSKKIVVETLKEAVVKMREELRNASILVGRAKRARDCIRPSSLCRIRKQLKDVKLAELVTFASRIVAEAKPSRGRMNGLFRAITDFTSRQELLGAAASGN